jgi:hypothetical protein
MESWNRKSDATLGAIFRISDNFQKSKQHLISLSHQQGSLKMYKHPAHIQKKLIYFLGLQKKILIS